MRRIVTVMINANDGVLAEDFPAWRIWRAEGGLWMATRQYRLTDTQLDAGLYMTDRKSVV